MNKKEARQELESNGSAQTRKTYARHGIKGNVFGVSYAFLGKLAMRIRVDHALAEQLWASGNFDARVLATMIADPSRLTRKTADVWVKDYDNHGLVDAFAGLVARSPSAKKCMEKWGKARSEWIGATGWAVLCHLAKLDRELPDSFFAEKLDVIEAEIHGRKNRVRSSMNWAVIAIGGRNGTLEKLATAAARRIGRVEVDHGDTSCKTPDAVSYIKKTAAHQRELTARRKARQKAKKAAGKKARTA